MTTPRLDLPYLLPGQAQKHVTHNEGLSRLDTLVQTVAVSASVPAPEAPADGDIYLVPASLLTDWDGATAGDVAARQDGAWHYVSPAAGWSCFVQAIGETMRFDGAEWGRVDRLGVNHAPDDENRLALAGAASLFNHLGGDHRLKINKQSAENTAAMLYQSDSVAHAEIGLCEDHDLHMKVSEDGLTFTEALTLAHQSGEVTVGVGLNLPDGVKIRNNGTSAASGVEIIGGGGLGPVSLRVLNDASAGVAGALFAQHSSNPDIDLVDFAFQTLTEKMNVRVESRPAFAGSGGTPEFQVFHNIEGSADDYILRASPHAVLLEKPVTLVNFPVAALPDASAYAPGSLIFVSDAAGGAEPAYSDGTVWRLCSSRSIVS